MRAPDASGLFAVFPQCLQRPADKNMRGAGGRLCLADKHGGATDAILMEVCPPPQIHAATRILPNPPNSCFPTDGARALAIGV